VCEWPVNPAGIAIHRPFIVDSRPQGTLSFEVPVKILLLEDDRRLGDVLVRAFRQAGHSVDHVETVEDGGWQAHSSSYDVIVLDVMLPDGDGYSLCAKLREEGIWTPVLMLTARDAVPDRVRGLDVGADDYLVKPFVLAELEARLRALARRGAVPRPTVLRAGSLALDPARHTVTIGSERVEVTAREFSLLEYFLRRADAVLPRARIIDEVWDWAFEGDPRIVDVYVRLLRKKIHDHIGAPRIETIRGRGYVLRSPAPLAGAGTGSSTNGPGGPAAVAS
jgi:two-component system OmpR family response regulator